MNLDRFEGAVQAAFAFLEDDFGMTVKTETKAERSQHSWVPFVTYTNDRAFVRVELDNRERVFNILFGPLVDGDIPPYPIFLEREDEELTWFPLWAVLQSRGEQQPPFSFAEDERLDHELAAWAAALRDHTAGALEGEFDQLREPTRRVRSQEWAAATERDNRLLGLDT